MKLIDSHCHLETKDFPVAGEVIERAKLAGVVHAVVVGLLQKPGDFGHALAAAQEHPDFLTPTIGVHPHDAAQATQEDWDTLARLAALPEVKAVGETGLDYYYDHSPRDVQAAMFRRQCQLAKQVGKPIVIHVRDAHQECASILESEGIRDGMIHCFTGDTAAARKYLDLGFFLSISGVVTYKKTEPLQEAVKFAPLDRLMVETDSPYLSPMPYRGKWPNEPSRVAETAKKVAELHGRDAEEVALICARNTARLLGIRVAL
ncbi:MAG: TatD family hydrolase [Archangium sp.]|nr:TatD family hydrolase [Archangium sp.]MDP3152386.1 TatD family hydrolase [Archangium sp.]MDP3574061.1 TatD family hydrolase [Archangium sp.]